MSEADAARRPVDLAGPAWIIADCAITVAQNGHDVRIAGVTINPSHAPRDFDRKSAAVAEHRTHCAADVVGRIAILIDRDEAAARFIGGVVRIGLDVRRIGLSRIGARCG